jgi:surface antigen
VHSSEDDEAGCHQGQNTNLALDVLTSILYNTSMNSIPKRGPAVVKLSSGETLDLWYDRGCRSWVLQQKDVEGNQIGPAYGNGASYCYNREDAVHEMEQIMAKESK